MTSPPLIVVGRGEGYAVIDKPAGVRSVPGRGEHAVDSVETRVRTQCPEADGPIAVHRLDIETSGLIVVGLTRLAHHGGAKLEVLTRHASCRVVSSPDSPRASGAPIRLEGVLTMFCPKQLSGSTRHLRWRYALLFRAS